MKFNFCFSSKKSPKRVLFSKEECNALFSALLIDDKIDLDVSMPDSTHINYTQDQLWNCYQISLQLWEEGIKREALCLIIDKIYNQGKLNEQDQYSYYCMRAKIKHLRFAFALFDKSHTYPTVFHWMAAIMGHLQDILKNAQSSSIWPVVMLVRLFLSKPLYAISSREVYRFKPSTSEQFKNYVNDGINFIRAQLEKDKMTSHEFHEIRKVISRLVAFYDCMYILYPSDYQHAVLLYLSTINGLMGSMHDDLIAADFNKIQNYHKDTFLLPEEIRVRLKAFTDKYHY